MSEQEQIQYRRDYTLNQERRESRDDKEYRETRTIPAYKRWPQSQLPRNLILTPRDHINNRR